MRAGRIPFVLLGCVMAALGATLPAGEQSGQQSVTQRPLFTVKPLTTHGRADLSAVSPDGRRVAYARRESPGFEVRLLNPETGRDEVLIDKAMVEYWGMDFAPDRSALYVTRAIPPRLDATLAESERYKLLRIRLADRRVETVIGNMGTNSGLDVSPDGRTVTFVRTVREPQGTVLVFAPLDGGPERPLARRTAPASISQPSWRPDGGTILFRTLDPGHGAGIAEVDLSDGRERVLVKPEGWGNASTQAWLPDGRSFLVAANQGSAIWRVSYPSGTLQRLGVSAPEFGTASLTYLVGARDSPMIVATRYQTQFRLWIGGVDARDPTAEQSWPSGLWNPRWATGEKLISLRYAASGPEMVTTEMDGRVVGAVPLAVPAPRFLRMSRAGDFIVVNSYAQGDRSYWRAGRNGEQPAKLTSGPADYYGHDLSPDGRWAAYTTFASGRPAVWRVELSGGTPHSLFPVESMLPAISPDGKWVAAYYRRSRQERWGIALVPATGGNLVHVGDLPIDESEAPGLQWTPQGALSFSCRVAGASNICVVPRTGGAVRQVTRFTEGPAGAHHWSPKGRLLVERNRVTSDIVRIVLKEQ